MDLAMDHNNVVLLRIIVGFPRNIVVLVAKVPTDIARMLLEVVVLLVGKFVHLGYVALNMVIVGVGQLTVGLAARLVMVIASNLIQFHFPLFHVSNSTLYSN
jgi:hypothetical protein